jgi:selenocysteine-specific elongation factor
MEIGDYLRGSFLDPANAPIVAVSSKTGAGLDELRAELAKLATEVPVKDANAAFRLPIDRVFTMKGFGTVVTGTLISGSVRKDEELEVHPTGKRLRARGVQVHGAAAEKAIAGQRTALNLVGAETSELARGMMLTQPGLFRPTRRVSVKLNLLPSAKPLRDGARVHLHVYTAETIAEVSLLGMKQLQPGQSGLTRLKLDDPIMLLPGDRFIVRQFSPVITIGGGIVLDASELGRRIRAEDRLVFLSALESADAAGVLAARVTRRGADGLSLDEAVAETGSVRSQVESLAAENAKSGGLLRFSDVLVSTKTVSELRSQTKAAVDAFHQANPLVAGISREELREKLGVGPEIYRGVEDLLVHAKVLQVAGELVHTTGRGVVLRDEEAESKKQIEMAFASAGLRVPLLKDVVASLPIDKNRAQKIVTLLLRDRVLVKVGDELVFHRDALDGLRRLVVAQKAKAPKMNVVAFKDLIGVTRKYAIPLLEWLDSQRVTRRVGDERVIL